MTLELLGEQSWSFRDGGGKALQEMKPVVFCSLLRLGRKRAKGKDFAISSRIVDKGDERIEK